MRPRGRRAPPVRRTPPAADWTNRWGPGAAADEPVTQPAQGRHRCLNAITSGRTSGPKQAFRSPSPAT